MELGVAERGFSPRHYPDYFDNFLLDMKWDNYGKRLIRSLKGRTDEKQVTNLKRLDSVLEEFGNNIGNNPKGFFIDYDIYWSANDKKEFPEKKDIFSKFINLIANYAKYQVESNDLDKHDFDSQYKLIGNFIQNTRRAIKRIINNEPLYLIQRERNNFWHFANELSYAPEKRF